MNNEWETPDELFQRWHERFKFTVDAAARAHNTRLEEFFTDGLAADWRGHNVWCNPPYGRGELEKWTKKAAERRAEIAVLLLPVDTSTQWFHRWVYPYARLEFLEKRIRFKGATGSPKFGSMLAIYEGNK